MTPPTRTRSFFLEPPALLARLPWRFWGPELADRINRRRHVAWPVLAWLPLLILTYRSNAAQLDVPFLRDFEVHVRLLLGVPLLVAAERIVGAGIESVIAHLHDRGLVAGEDLPRLDRAVARLETSVLSAWAEMAVVTIAYADVVMRTGANPWGPSSWRATSPAADLWYQLIAQPLYEVQVIRWLWWFTLWAEFLWRVSLLRLRLLAPHPDAMGGLGFVSVGHARFALVIFALSMGASARLGEHMVFGGETLQTLRPLMIGLIVIPALVVLAPLLVFSVHLLQTRRKGLIEYGAFAYGYIRAFQATWVDGAEPRGEDALGSSDIQSLADTQNSFNGVRRMRVILWDTVVLMPVMLAAILPMLPLVLSSVPMNEVIRRVLKLVM